MQTGGLERGPEDSNRSSIVREDPGNGCAGEALVGRSNPGKSQLQQQPQAPDTLDVKKMNVSADPKCN